MRDRDSERNSYSEKDNDIERDSKSESDSERQRQEYKKSCRLGTQECGMPGRLTPLIRCVVWVRGR